MSSEQGVVKGIATPIRDITIKLPAFLLVLAAASGGQLRNEFKSDANGKPTDTGRVIRLPDIRPNLS